MDVLYPQLIRFGEMCYRKNPIYKTPLGVSAADDEDDGEEQKWPSKRVVEADDYADEEDCSVDARSAEAGEETCGVDMCSVMRTPNGFFSHTFDLPSSLYKFIIGAGGAVKKKLEYETKTTIRIPRQGEVGNITIEGSEKNGVISARTRIDLIVASSRRKLPFTHFISLPLTGDENIRLSFEDFQQEVLQISHPADGIDASIFTNVDKLHLTIGTMTLLDANEVQAASQLLANSQHLVNEILCGDPLDLDIRGLEYMNDDPGCVDVLYAKVMPIDGSQRLQRLADRLVDVFVAAHLMNREYDRVKLHATIMNTRHRKHDDLAQGGTGGVEGSDRWGPGRGGRGGRGRGGQYSGSLRGNGNFRRDERESFNAKDILLQCGEYSFGHYRLREIHISQREFTGRDGYYAAAASIRLPS